MDRKIAGFSLFEVLIVIAIISILMFFSINWYLRYQSQRLLQQAANNIANELGWIKAQSIGSVPHGIFIDDNNRRRYIIFRDNNLDCNRNIDGSEDIRTVNLPNTVNATAGIVITVDRRGYPLNAICGLGMQTIRLREDFGNEKEVIIDRYGRIRIQ
ncbi:MULTISPECIES: pilus assembly FimT family protein [Thermodesulfovibrio]|uniref:pilus assembly FimT family protein n=1 Tax=Thermodesulfovibrio TaxID=28261 RepID=UPI00260FB376|nr:prepilin-type N-terminal cleavage/methylation domain-containing protein [Thermodesulfovibrio sp.]